MAKGYVIPVDPSSLSNNYASDPFTEEEVENVIDESLEEEFDSIFSTASYEDRIAPLLNRIPEREADLIDLYYIKKKRQADIAAIFGVTQAAISYRLDRGLQRIKFLLEIPDVTEEELRENLPKVFPKPMDVDILVGMWQTTCQSEVAKQLNLTQGRVRHRFFKAVETLSEAAQKDSLFEPYHKIFARISNKGFNMTRCVVLPQWQDRGGDEVA